jgi:hypothetical protein
VEGYKYLFFDPLEQYFLFFLKALGGGYKYLFFDLLQRRTQRNNV